MQSTSPRGSAIAPPALQRARGAVRAVFEYRDGLTRLAEHGESGAAKLRMANTYGPVGQPVLINTAGGLTGGDRLTIALEARAGTRVAATTPASEKVYRSLGEDAVVETRIAVGPGARFHWLPQETILYDRARLRRSYDVELAENSRFLAVEAIVLGRRAMGENVETGAFHDRWRIRRGGRLIFADDIVLDGAVSGLAARAAALGGTAAFATMIFIAEDCEERLEAVRDILGAAGGASGFGGKLIARLTAEDGLALRAVLTRLVALLGDGAAPPKMWLQ